MNRDAADKFMRGKLTPDEVQKLFRTLGFREGLKVGHAILRSLCGPCYKLVIADSKTTIDKYCDACRGNAEQLITEAVK